ncbi:MAG: hypothetical protein ABIE42_10170 [Candidatus Eisenbacteria bacterium]
MGTPGRGQAPEQEQPGSEQDARGEALRVFLDCDGCDFDYLRTAITFINHVRDRRDAQVHVIVTREFTAGGGTAYTFDFVGLEDLDGIDDRLSYFSSQNETDDEERRGIAQSLRLGLVRYAAATDLGQALEITQTGVSGRQQVNAQPADDPWNFWVFRARFDTRLDGEERETSKSFGGSFSANRTTDQWKMNYGINFDYDEDAFELGSGATLRDISRDHSLTARAIKSLGEHWGFGVGGSAVTTTFRNQDLTVRFAPAIEYNVFPYSESTRRQFTIRYATGVDRFDYSDETLFGKTSERRVDHSLVTSLDFNEQWGDSELTLEFAQFLDEPSNYRVVLFGDIEIRLFRGFFLSLRGDTSLVRDQIFLKAGGVTDAEILLRRRQLATAYEYSFRVGVTYSFGSIFNNVVNSRFDGSSGGFIRAF